MRKHRRVVRKKTSVWRSWRHFAAYMYLFICFFDFVGMPVFYEWAHRPLGDLELLAAIREIDPLSQVEVLKVLSTQQRWEPLTLGESGLFHLAFGAILGVAAWTRGNEKIHRAKSGLGEDEVVEEFESEPTIEEEPK